MCPASTGKNSGHHPQNTHKMTMETAEKLTSKGSQDLRGDRTVSSLGSLSASPILERVGITFTALRELILMEEM